MYRTTHNKHREKIGKELPTSTQDTEEYFDQRIKIFGEDMIKSPPQEISITILENTSNSTAEAIGRKDGAGGVMSYPTIVIMVFLSMIQSERQGFANRNPRSSIKAFYFKLRELPLYESFRFFFHSVDMALRKKGSAEVALPSVTKGQGGEG